MERETGLEPATNSLEGCHSTLELLPRLLVPDTALPGWHPAYILRQGAAGVKPLPRPRIMLKSPGWVVIHSVRQGSLRASEEPAGFGCRPGAAKAPRRKRHDAIGQPIAS
jgi:hypothetical protein